MWFYQSVPWHWKKVIAEFIFSEVVLIYVYLYSPGVSHARLYTICIGLGVTTGYWAVLMLLFFKEIKNSFGVTNAARVVAMTVVNLTYVSLYLSEETYEKDLGFVEK